MGQLRNIFTRLRVCDHARCPSKIFVTQMLTRDLFVTADILSC